MDSATLGAAVAIAKKNAVDPAVIEGAVADWLDDHPEATTTVQDGSITKAKLDSNLQGTVDDVGELKSHFDALETTVADQLGGVATKTPTLDITEGRYVASNNGTTNVSTGAFYCDYVDVSNAIDHKITITDLIYNASSDAVAFCAWYDQSKTYIGSLYKSNAGDYGVSLSWSLQTVTIQLPSNAAYVRLSGTTIFSSMTTDDLAVSYQYRTSGDVYDAISEKLDTDQGTSNEGKTLVVGNDGLLIPSPVPLPGELEPSAINLSGLLVKTGNLCAGITLNVATEATSVYRTGKNIFLYSTSTSGYAGSANVDSFDSNNQAFDMTVKSGGSAYLVRTNFIPVSVGDKITVSTECMNQYGNCATPILRTYDSSFAVMSTGANGTYNSTYKGFLGDVIGGAFTYEITSSDVKYVCFGFALRAANGVSIGDSVKMRCQAEVGTVATDWEKSVSNYKTPSGGTTTFEALNGINTLFPTRPYTLTVTGNNPSYAKTVNGKTGTIVLDAEDVGALPEGWDGYNDIVHRNADMWQAVNACARYGHSSGSTWNADKQFTMMITADPHHDTKRLQNAFDYMNWSRVIDCGFCLGDMQMNNFSDDDGTWFTGMVNASAKKMYPMIGNHDAGMGTAVATVGSKEQQFNKFFSPVLTKLGLTGLETTYYSITEGDLVIIVLDCYDIPDTLTDESTYTYYHGSCSYSQDQIDWFVDTLENIPSGKHLLILVHDTPEVKTVEECAWSDKTYSGTDYPYTGMIPEIVDAWQNGTALSKTFSPSYTSSLGTRTVDADFSTRGTGIFAGYIHGHRHRDFIQTITAYPNQNAISLAGTLLDVSGNANSDLPRIINTRSEDAVTVVTVDTVNRLIKLVRIGSNVTFEMEKRDIYAVSY